MKCFIPVICLFAVFLSNCGRENASEVGATDTGSSSDTDTHTETNDDELFTIFVSTSEAIATVRTVEWSVADTDVLSARIDFGLDQTYGMSAPVDLSEPSYRTPLLGMKPSRQYHFRIFVWDGETEIKSADRVIETGPVHPHLPQVVLSPAGSAAEKGFVLSVFYENCIVFVLDADGEFVWWAFLDMNFCSRAHISHDAKQILVRDVNVNNILGKFGRVSVDGLNQEVIDLPDSHHDFTVLPDGTLGLIYFDEETCDDIWEMSPDGTLSMVYHLSDGMVPIAGPDGCHANSIHYHPDDDTYTISALNTSQYAKVTRGGELLWLFGGTDGTFDLEDPWEFQHGHQILDNGNFLLFNNRPEDEKPAMLEYALNEDTFVATLVWSFEGDGETIVFGDVERLPGGNTFITYSVDGYFLEVNPAGDVVRQIDFIHLNDGTMTRTLGYADWRESLYVQ